MYSVVLMMAISGSAEAPDHGLRRHGCDGGCYGAAVANCGCYGGGRHGLFGGRRHGGCYGGGCYGGGCYGGCYGGGVVVCGCYGGGYGGCYGGGMIVGGCYGGCYGGAPAVGAPAGPAGKPPEDVKKMPKPEGAEKKPDGGTSLAPTTAPATLVVSLPADAKLTIDDNATTSTGARRMFVTPSLKLGGEYHYTLKAETLRNGKANVIEQVVTVRPGQLTQVTLEQPSTSVAAR